MNPIQINNKMQPTMKHQLTQILMFKKNYKPKNPRIKNLFIEEKLKIIILKIIKDKLDRKLNQRKRKKKIKKFNRNYLKSPKVKNLVNTCSKNMGLNFLSKNKNNYNNNKKRIRNQIF